MRAVLLIISVISLLLGVTINIVFYVKGFESFGFTSVLSIIMSAGLLYFEASNRISLLKENQPSKNSIFIILIIFSVLFNLSGFAASFLGVDQNNKIADSKTINTDEQKKLIQDQIDYTIKEKEKNDANLTFYSWQTKKYEPVTPLIESEWIRTKKLPEIGLSQYRSKSEEYQKTIDSLYKSLMTEREVFQKTYNVFSLIDNDFWNTIIKLFFFSFLSVLIALMPSMSMKYLYESLNFKQKKIDDFEIRFISTILWSSTSKSGAINSIENVKAFYKTSVLKDFIYEKEVREALQKMQGVLIYKSESNGHYYPNTGVTREQFLNSLMEIINDE